MRAKLAATFRKWFALDRLLPSLTVLGAGVALILAQIGIISLTTAENIIISLLALIAVDTLSERLGFLARIEERLKAIAPSRTLQNSTRLLPPTQQAVHASDICIVAVHATSVILRYQSFYESKLREGCNIRIVLLDPECDALDTWNLINRDKIAKHEILASLGMLEDLIQVKARGKCKVRLLSTFLPFSMFAVDLERKTGAITVSFHPYKLPGDRRPHIHLTRADDPEWFDYFKEQFDLAWGETKDWLPQAQEIKSRSAL